MQTKRGQLNCLTNRKNVGFGSCFLDWKIIKGAFLYSNPRVFTPAEILDLQDSLMDDATSDIKASRSFPIHNFVAPTDNSEAVAIETFDYGSRQITKDGFNDWGFQYVDGGACLQSALRTHNGKGDVLFYDKDNKLMGWNKSTGFSTIPLEMFYAEPFKLATGAAVAKYMVRFVFQPKYSNEESDFIVAPFDLAEVVGLQDINIIVNTFNDITGVVNATLQLACGADNVYDLYSAQITTASFVAVDQDGNVVTVLTVALQPSNKTFNITLNAANFPLPGGTVILGGVAISVLTAQGIIGYEIDTVNLPILGTS